MKSKILIFPAIGLVFSLVACANKENSFDVNNFNSFNSEQRNEDIYATSIALDVHDLQLDTYAKRKFKLHATVEPANYTGEITWESKNQQLVTVTDDGVVTCLTNIDSAGELSTLVTVSAQASVEGDTVSDECRVNVEPIVNEIKITSPDPEIHLARGESVPLVAEVYPEASKDHGIEWVSDNPSVAKVIGFDSEPQVVAVADSGIANIYAYSHQSPNVSAQVKVTITNELGKYSLIIGENSFVDTSAVCLKTESESIHKSADPAPYVKDGSYLVLPKMDAENKSSIWIDESSFNNPWKRIRSLQIFYEGGNLDVTLSNSQHSSVYTDLPSGAKIYDYSDMRFFNISNDTDEDVAIKKIIVNFGYGSEYDIVKSEFNYSDDTPSSNWTITGNFNITSNTDGFLCSQYLSLQDVAFTVGNISYDLNVNDSATADLLPKGITLFAESENANYSATQLFTGVKTAEEISESVGTGLAGYLTEYIQDEDPLNCGYAYYSGANPILTNPVVESRKPVHIDTIVERNSDLLYDDRSVSLYQDGVFKTQNSISVFDGIYNPGNKYVGISLNQKDASISNLKIISYDETKLWNGSDKSSALLGEGTQDNPYLISSADDLAYMANQVNYEDRSLSSYYKSYYRLTKDISLNGQNWGGIGISLGSIIKAFEGDFDGNNHRISGVHTDGTSGTALFNYIGNANIHDLKICGVFSGGSTYTAALAAHIIHPVSAEADEPLNCHISNIITEGHISGYYSSLSGLVGVIEQTHDTDKVIIESCSNRASIINFHYSSKSLYTSGIVSEIKTDDDIFTEPIAIVISKCINYGVLTIPRDYNHLYVGGIISFIDVNTEINECIQFGDINTYSSTVQEVGGIVGMIYGGKVTKCLCYEYSIIAGDFATSYDFDGTLYTRIGAICGARTSEASSSSIVDPNFCNIKGEII